MSRRRVIAGFVVLTALAVAVAVVGVVRSDEGIDEDEYAARNLRLLAELPVFPGARPLSTISDKAREPGTSVICNTTSRSFGLRGEMSRARVTRFYKTQMRGWRVAENSEARFALSFRRGEEFVHLLVYTPRDYVLSVDHRCRGSGP